MDVVRPHLLLDLAPGHVEVVLDHPQVLDGLGMRAPERLDAALVGQLGAALGQMDAALGQRDAALGQADIALGQASATLAPTVELEHCHPRIMLASRRHAFTVNP